MIRAVAVAALGLVVPAFADPPAPAVSLIGPALRVSDFDRSAQFYTQAFGMVVVTKLDFGRVHEMILGFSKEKPQPGIILMQDSALDPSKSIDHGNGFSRVVLRVASLDAINARLVAAGMKGGEVHAPHAGYRVMNITDPGGYRYELVESHAPATEKTTNEPK